MTSDRVGRGIAAGFVIGALTGIVVWSRQQHLDRRALFSGNPLRRLAALGYLRARPSVENARLLSDYVKWESRPLLRRRGEVLLRWYETHLLE